MVNKRGINLTESAFSGGEISLTLKHGGGYGDPWLVFRSASAEGLKQQVLDFFDIEGVSEDATPAEVAYLATADSLSKYAIHGNLEAKTVSSSKPKTRAVKPAATSTESSDSSESEVEYVKELFAQAESVEDVKRVWAENKKLCSGNDELLATYKARGKELSGK